MRGWIWLFDHPRFLPLVIAPLLLGMALVLIGFVMIYPFVPQLTEFFMAYIPTFGSETAASFIFAFLWIVLILLLTGFGMLLLYFIYVVLCAPFHAILVEGVLKSSGRHRPGPLSFGAWLALTLRMLRTSMVKIFFFLIIATTAFLLSFIPGLQWLTLATSAAIFAFDSLDYSFEALQWGFRQRLNYVWREKRQFFLMGFGMALTLLIPGLTFFALPGAVVGAALVVKTEKA